MPDDPMVDGELTRTSCPIPGCTHKLRYIAFGPLQSQDPLYIPMGGPLYECDVHGSFAYKDGKFYPQ